MKTTRKRFGPLSPSSVSRGATARCFGAFSWVPVLLLAGCATVEREPAAPVEEAAFTNPYANVAWDEVGYHDANFHTHTNFSDGRHDPHYAIDTYHDMGYDILALTDHDVHHVEVWPRPLYPWTELNAIFHEIKDEMSVRFKKPYGEVADEEWEDRDPEELGMVSVPGSEISATDHLSSLFNDYAGGTDSEETAFTEIGERGGLAVFNHPGRFDRARDWYIDFFNRHPHVVGMEVYNQVDRYPVDRTRWDSILHELMPERPVWGLANDDTHTDEHFGRNRNVFLLTDFSEKGVFNAMKDGRFYFFVPTEQGTPPSVKLTGVAVEGETIALELEGEYDHIDWVTYGPETEESLTVGNGPKISLGALPKTATFVRAVIIDETGKTYTQPFGVRSR